MTPNQALKQRKQLCREMRATSAAMWRLYSLGIAHIQKRVRTSGNKALRASSALHVGR
jgi:hypothetical protein